MNNILGEISHDTYLFQVNYFTQSGWIGHAPFLKFLIREQRPKVFVELGVHNGFSYFVGCQAIVECQLETKAFAVDHWLGDEQAGFFTDEIFEEVKNVNTKFESFSSLLKMDFSKALELFHENQIDLLHIDGFHSYASVKDDFNSWLSRMSPHGIIILHDIYVHREGFGVNQFWKEIRTQYKSMEFVGSHGLGVIFLGKVPEGKLADLFQISVAGCMSDIQGTFGSISDDVLQISQSYSVDISIAERDSALAERDSALAERDLIISSTIWRLFSPYRKTITFFRRS